MKRVYVIMRQKFEEGYDEPIIEPYDVVSSMTQAEEDCILHEERSDTYHEGWEYYWREVISSEG